MRIIGYGKSIRSDYRQSFWEGGTTTYESEPKSKGELIAVMASVARAVSGKGKQGLVRIHSSLVGPGGVGTPAGPEMKRKCKEISFKPFFEKLRNQVLHDLHVEIVFQSSPDTDRLLRQNFVGRTGYKL